MLDLLLPPKCLGSRGPRYTGKPINLCSVINAESRSHLRVTGAEWRLGGVLVWALTDTAACVFLGW